MKATHTVARFETGPEAPALMDHPHVALVLDAGATGVRDSIRGRTFNAAYRRSVAETPVT